MEPQPLPPQSNKKSWPKIIAYGFLLFIITNILIFVLSLVTGSESTEYPAEKHLWVGLVLALLVAGCSWWLSRRLHPATTKQALTIGASWAILNIGFMLFITIPNETTSKIFGLWVTYLVYVGIALGPVLRKSK
jgi:hypothetical protein